MLQRRWLRWTLIFVGWTCAGLFFASQTYLSYKYSGGQAHTGIILKLNLADWYVWGLLAPGIIWLARRFPLERAHWARSAAVHLVAGVGVALLKWWLDNLFREYALGLSRGTSLIYVFHGNLLTVSIGVANFPGDGSDAEELLAEADRRMYKQKRAHRTQPAETPAWKTEWTALVQ